MAPEAIRIRASPKAARASSDLHLHKDGVLRSHVSNRVVRTLGRTFLAAIWTDVAAQAREKRCAERVDAAVLDARRMRCSSPASTAAASRQQACRMSGYTRDELLTLSVCGGRPGDVRATDAGKRPAGRSRAAPQGR
jgi:hypothetical protein